MQSLLDSVLQAAPSSLIVEESDCNANCLELARDSLVEPESPNLEFHPRQLPLHSAVPLRDDTQGTPPALLCIEILFFSGEQSFGNKIANSRVFYLKTRARVRN